MIAFTRHHRPSRDAASAVIHHAIDAAGGRDRMTAYRAMTWNEQGIYLGLESRLSYQGDYAIQFPNRYRMRVKGAFTIVVNGEEGWINNNGIVERLPAAQMKEYREANHAIWAMQLHPLLDDDQFHVRRLWDHEGIDPDLTGIRVTSASFRDLDLYFDPDSMLLCKSVRKGIAPEFSETDVTMVTDYEGHSQVDGVMLPTRMCMDYDGRRVLETRTGGYELLTDIDPAMFDRP